MGRHFDFRDRVNLQSFIETNPRCTAFDVAERLGKSRNAVYYELLHYTTTFKPKSVTFNHSDHYDCPQLHKFPFCCNSCARTKCSHRSREYDAYKANAAAHNTLVKSRVDTKHRKETVDILNKTVSQLIIDGQSIKVAMLSVNRIDVSESTIRRYINRGLLNARRHHLPQSVRFKVKKEYNYSGKKIAVNVLYKRTYQDYLNHMLLNPTDKVIQIDSVIGKSNDRCALLTIFFLNSKLQLAIKYDRKHSNVNKILLDLYKAAATLGYHLFDVILTDNGSEMKRLPELEMDNGVNVRFHVFYCDPYRSCQKAECERNHGFIRRFYRKGRSFDPVSQEELDQILSHINAYPRGSLNNRSPYDLFILEYSSIIANILNIDYIPPREVSIKAK